MRNFSRCLVLVVAVAILMWTLFVGQLSTQAIAQNMAGLGIGADSRLLQAPTTFKHPLAYIGADGNVYVTDDSSGSGIPVTGDSATQSATTDPFFTKNLFYGQLVWSLDAKKLAFTEKSHTAVFLEMDGQAATLVNTTLDSGFPPAFSPQSDQLAYVVKTPQTIGSTGLVLQIQAIPVAGGSPAALGSIQAPNFSCGTDNHGDAGEVAYFSEVGNQSVSPMFFAWTKAGYLHSLDCFGRGLALSNGSQDVWQSAQLENVAISADQSQILAVQVDDFNAAHQTRALVLVDMATGKVTPVTTKPDVDRATFSTDGKTIIYSTISPNRTVKSNPAQAIGTQLFPNGWPLPDVQEYGVFLWSVPVAGGDSTQLFKEAGRGVGFITPDTGKDAVVFSLVTSLAKMIDVINNGGSADAAHFAAPHTEIRSVPLDANGLPSTLFMGGEPAYSTAESFAAIPATPSAPPTLVVGAPTSTIIPTLVAVVPTASSTPFLQVAVGGNCPGALPSRLVIGGFGDVVAGGAANNIRIVPATGDIIGQIPPLSVFSVLQGPFCTSNGIAWWQVSFNGITGYSAEGVSGTYYLEPYIGGPTATQIAPTGTFGIVGVTAKVNVTSATICPTKFDFSGQIVVNEPGTVTYRWERSDGAMGPTVTLGFGSGVTTQDVSDSWTLSASFNGSEHIHILTPNDVSSNNATFTLSCGPTPTPHFKLVTPPVLILFQVTKVTNAQGISVVACPKTVNFNGSITTNAAGTVTYQWDSSKGMAVGGVHTLVFTGAATKAVHLSLTYNTAYSGWVTLHVTKPNLIYSNQVNFSGTCP